MGLSRKENTKQVSPLGTVLRCTAAEEIRTKRSPNSCCTGARVCRSSRNRDRLYIRRASTVRKGKRIEVPGFISFPSAGGYFPPGPSLTVKSYPAKCPTREKEMGRSATGKQRNAESFAPKKKKKGGKLQKSCKADVKKEERNCGLFPRSAPREIYTASELLPKGKGREGGKVLKETRKGMAGKAPQVSQTVGMPNKFLHGSEKREDLLPVT